MERLHEGALRRTLYIDVCWQMFAGTNTNIGGRRQPCDSFELTQAEQHIVLSYVSVHLRKAWTPADITLEK